MTSTHSRFLAGSVGLLGALVCVGCETLPFGAVVREVKNSLNDAGLVAVMPAREDIRVGDLYVYGSNPDFGFLPTTLSASEDGQPFTARWGSLDLLAELTSEYQLRPDWPKTPDEFFRVADDPATRSLIEASSSPASLFDPGQPPTRLRIVDLGLVLSRTFSKGNLETLIPTEAINLALGTNWRDSKAVTLRTTAAESYALPIDSVLDKLFEDVQEESGSFIDPDLREHLSLLSVGDRVWMRVVTEVVYVRSVDIAIQSRQDSEEDEDLEASELQPAEERALDADDENDEVDPAFGAFMRAEAINNVLMKTDHDDLPGGFVRFLSITDDSVSVRRTWQRGIAVGVRGLTIELDARTGEVVRLWPMGIKQTTRRSGVQQLPRSDVGEDN